MGELTSCWTALASQSCADKPVQSWKFAGVYCSAINKASNHLWSAANTPASPWARNGFSQCACGSPSISRRRGAVIDLSFRDHQLKVPHLVPSLDNYGYCKAFEMIYLDTSVARGAVKPLCVGFNFHRAVFQPRKFGALLRNLDFCRVRQKRFC